MRHLRPISSALHAVRRTLNEHEFSSVDLNFEAYIKQRQQSPNTSSHSASFYHRFQQRMNASVASATVDPTVFLLSEIFSYVCLFYELPFWLSGLLFNALTVIIFSCSPLGTTPTTRVYYLVIGICDLLTLIFKHGFWYLFSYGVFSVGSPSVWRAVDNQVMCNMCRLVWASAETVATNTLVALGVERVIVLFWPFSVRLLTRWRALVGLAFLSAFGVTLNGLSVDIGPAQAASVFSVVFCSSSGLTSTTLSILRSMSLLCIYFVPSVFSIILAALITSKVRSIVQTRAKMTKQAKAKTNEKEKENLSKGELDSCVTILVMSIVHVTLFIPLTVFRTFTILLPYSPLNSAISPTLKQTFQVVGYLMFVFVVPVHCSDFVIYCRRVPSFWINVKRLCTLKAPLTNANDLARSSSD